MNLRSTIGFVSAVCVSLLGCSDSGGTDDNAGGAAGLNGVAGDASGGTSGGGATSNGGAGGDGQAGTETGGTAGVGGAPENSGGGGSGGIGGSAGDVGSGGTGGSGGSVGVRIGSSVGCNSAPPQEDSSDDYVTHEVTITGLDPVYLQGGENYENSGPYDFSHRPYGVRLPQNYNPAHPYAVTFGGGGCGGNAQNFANGPGGGLQIGGNNSDVIHIGLSYIAGCFNDGGPSIDNRTDTPEEPYFRAVMADIEQHYCIDLSKVFVAGYSSGGWEAYTLGCAAADLVRGIGADEGGMRDMRPECKGPVAAVLVAGTADTENPIGPLDDNDNQDKNAINRLGSHGSAPGRDDILQRNGCVGTETEPYSDPEYSACVKYTGCPEAYPVIWCALPGVGHNNSSYMGTNYSPGPMWDVLSALPPPR